MLMAVVIGWTTNAINAENHVVASNVHYSLELLDRSKSSRAGTLGEPGVLGPYQCAGDGRL